MITAERIIITVGAVVAVLLQALVAPHIAVGYGIPNIIAVFCIAVSIVQPNMYKYIMPFVLGLLYDLVSGGPVGAMAFSLTAATALACWFHQHSSNDTVFMGLMAMALGLLCQEVVYSAFALMFGYASNLLQAFMYRMLPCLLYNLVLGLIAYPLAERFLSTKAPLRSEITQLH